MMASNIFSRLLPAASDVPYETEPLNDAHRRHSSSTDGQHAMDIDEENLGARFEPQDLEHLLADTASSHMTVESHAPGTKTAKRSAGWRQPAPARHAHIDDDDDVPQSLLLEGGPSTNPNQRLDGLPPPVPGPSTHQARAQWDTTRRQQQLHTEAASAPSRAWGQTGRPGQFTANPKEKALWLWVNQTDLDTYMRDVYEYYIGCGIYSMLLRRFLTLLQSAFVVGFMTFLSWCIDYSKLSESHKMSQVLVPKCTKRIHGFWIFALWFFIMYWLFSIYQMVTDLPRLRAMHDFYHHLLDIPDQDIQTVQWQSVVSRVMALRDLNLTTASNLSPETRKLLDSKSRQRLDAVDIASRLMRRENYLIALFNKEILDVTVPIPFLGNRYVFSETTRWHVNLAVMDFVFSSGPNGQFNQDFLKERNRRELVKRLKTRFFWTGIISIICAPFAVVFVLASYLFKYFTEYHKDPGQLSNRDFTIFAQWKFREFNELPHLFNRRRNMAYPFANLYLAQFPKDKTEQVSSFVAFVAGAFASILVVFTLLDSELFLNFEITPGKTAIFWIGILSTIYRVARGSSPQEDQVADPSYYIEHVIGHIRYMPDSWQDRLHTDEVRAEFAKLYQPKILIFAEEILSMVITPFLLIFRLPNCSERIVDFFREFSIVVDGLGVTCSYSMFPFNKGTQNATNTINNPANRPAGQREDVDLREDYFMAKDNKMLASYYGFLDTYATSGPRNYNNRLQGRGSFHPPPQFPNAFGAMSQTAQPLEPPAHTSSRAPSSSARPTPHRRTPRHPRDDPMSSLLLDPHHHPSSASTLRSPPRSTQHPRYRPHLPDQSVHPGSRIEEESTIGDSWRTSRLAQDDDEEEEEAPGANRGGVLQLLQQFSKAQAEGRGAAGVGV
ncbi:APG9-domain-containing protein [Dothidotthia symphoricarpi CBS 119687]|uniref:Autophagy-related protein 9 n=1 Tax=Dothidotthia symphoricarpi CBS 119687 TaxID=1392245 RepID=A0A6A6ATC1_9PLEO|nr:APG9-domain-containing protein [Dothidotthia symphoricarpi CBS 119687]KAF2134473.1 APG9-domain-containing protein [Dothidotthia symphoricarpi CBS 119687]